MTSIYSPWKYFTASIADEQTLLFTVITKSDLSSLACTLQSILSRPVLYMIVLRAKRKLSYKW